jgi:hypothetical protein
MGVVEAVIRALLYLCGIALVFYLVIWVLGAIGIHLPVMVVNILLVMLVLVAILILVRLFWPLVAGVDWFPRR